MFDKKLFVILVFLLFILQISFVSAQSDNQTELINESVESIGYSDINNFSNPKFVDHIEPSGYGDKMEFYQGLIPVHIESPCDGDLKVLVDDMEYCVWNFTKNKTIYIPTYNPESFNDNSKMNIDVGLHNISLIFNFNNFKSKDVNIFLDENSTLNFKFNKNYGSHITDTFVYYSTWNILKKDKTIHILNFTYNNLCEMGEYIIHMDNLDLWEDDNSPYLEILYCGPFGIIISSNNKIIYKESDTGIFEGLRELYEIYEVGVYNFTVINFLDGTMDSVLFKANKYQPKFNITHIVNGTGIKINIMIPQLSYYNVLASQFEYYAVRAFISVDNITKNLMIDSEFGDIFRQVSFENLSSGVHTLKIYCPGDNRSEEFYYSMSFEIEEGLDLDEGNENILDLINTANQNIQQNSSSDKNLSFIIGNNTSGNITSTGRVIKNHKDAENSYSNENNWNSNENIINSLIGVDKNTQSGSSSPTKKSYEVIKKSTSKSINEITQFQLIIIIIILLIIGYFKFGEKI